MRLKATNYRIISNRIVNKNFDPDKKLKALPYRELPHLSFQPKKKFKRMKRRKKLSKYAAKLNYRGRLAQFIQFQLHYGCISFKKLKKIYTNIKNKFERNNLFFMFLNYRLFNFVFLMNLCSSRRLGFFFIKKYGLIINEKHIYNPIFFIHFNDIIELSRPLKLKFFKRMIKKRMRFAS
jgi:ribosomal protein S4